MACWTLLAPECPTLALALPSWRQCWRVGARVLKGYSQGTHRRQCWRVVAPQPAVGPCDHSPLLRPLLSTAVMSVSGHAPFGSSRCGTELTLRQYSRSASARGTLRVLGVPWGTLRALRVLWVLDACSPACSRPPALQEREEGRPSRGGRGSRAGALWTAAMAARAVSFRGPHGLVSILRAAVASISTVVPISGTGITSYDYPCCDRRALCAVRDGRRCKGVQHVATQRDLSQRSAPRCNARAGGVAAARPSTCGRPCQVRRAHA